MSKSNLLNNTTDKLKQAGNDFRKSLADNKVGKLVSRVNQRLGGGSFTRFSAAKAKQKAKNAAKSADGAYSVNRITSSEFKKD